MDVISSKVCCKGSGRATLKCPDVQTSLRPVQAELGAVIAAECESTKLT